MKFAETLASRKPLLRLGQYRLRFDTHMLVGELVPPLGWSRFLPELAILVFAGAAIVTALLLSSGTQDAALSAIPAAVIAIVSALAAVRLEIHKRRRRGFVLNYATRTLRIDRTTRLLGTTRTLLIPFSDLAEAGVTRDAEDTYAFEVELKRADERTPPQVEALLTGVPEREVDELFRFAEMARAAFGLVPPGPN